MRCWIGDAAAQRADALDIARRDGFGVVDEPVQPGERHLAVDRLEHVQRARDSLVVRRVQPERPAVLGEEPDHAVRSRSMRSGMSGRGSRKSSKSAAE